MKTDLQMLFNSRLMEKVVIKTLIDGLKLMNRDSISVRELEKLLGNMK